MLEGYKMKQNYMNMIIPKKTFYILCLDRNDMDRRVVAVSYTHLAPEPDPLPFEEIHEHAEITVGPPSTCLLDTSPGAG